MLDIKGLQDYLGEDWINVRRMIRSALKSDIALLESTNESILGHSGKQLRPMLVLLIARACACGHVNGSTYRYAAAAELLHNATLLHDDVADNSSQRRGAPTIMSLLGPSVSVLIGDFWLVKAMSTILDASASSDRVIRLFSKTLSDLAEGEMLQLQKARSLDTDEDDYLRIIFNKTASLFEAAAVTAAISVDAGKEAENAARDYAVSLGLAFQIRDDIFDYSPSMEVGKPLGVDILEQKITLPLLGAFRKAGEKTAAEIRNMIGKITEHPEYRDEILDFVRCNGGIEYASERLDGFVEKAKHSLGFLPHSLEKEYLSNLADFVGERAI